MSVVTRDRPTFPRLLPYVCITHRVRYCRSSLISRIKYRRISFNPRRVQSLAWHVVIYAIDLKDTGNKETQSQSRFGGEWAKQAE